MNKRQLSERDICDKYVRPAMAQAGWNGQDQIYREFPLMAGRVVVRGRSGKRDKSTVLRADYALFYKANIPLAVVEAKDNHHAVGAGMAQAINYASLLDVPFCLSSNGDGFGQSGVRTPTTRRTIPHRHPRSPAAPPVRRPAPSRQPIHPSAFG